MPEPLVGPSLEPLTRAEAKLFLRIVHDDEDALVDALVVAARRVVEAKTGRVLLSQTWRFSRDAWPASGVIVAPVSPLAAIVSATVTAADGSLVAVPAGALTLVRERAPNLIHVDGLRVPAPGVAAGGIVLTVGAGYGASPADVPADLVQAVRLVLAHFYENRAGAGDAAQVPAAVEALLAPYRVVRL